MREPQLAFVVVVATALLFYAAVAPYVYRLTPLGGEAAQILDTVSFQKPAARADR